jgi:hypothetical protein
MSTADIVIVPLGERQSRPRSRFSAGLMDVLNGKPQSFLAAKRQREEGELVGKASAIIADGGSSDNDLRAAFLRVSVALEGALLRELSLQRRLRTLEAQVAQLIPAVGPSEA